MQWYDVLCKSTHFLQSFQFAIQHNSENQTVDYLSHLNTGITRNTVSKRLILEFRLKKSPIKCLFEYVCTSQSKNMY